MDINAMCLIHNGSTIHCWFMFLMKSVVCIHKDIPVHRSYQVDLFFV